MDTLDIALRAAWNRISKKARKERVEALKRSRRRFTGLLTNPLRQNCLVIRAADTRINDFSAIIDPRDAYDAREAHSVTLCGELIREITKPVIIPWPGVTYREAANICGREYMSIAGWVKRGVLRADRYPAFGFPCDGKRPLKPHVWTPSPIDPNAYECRPPHPAWGFLWRSRWEDIPENYELVVERVPHMVYFRKRVCFRGWHFICPGRLDENDEYKGCGRVCQYLFGPQSMWTLGQALGDESGFDMPEDSGLAGQWVPALHDAVRGPRSFACRVCWNVRSSRMTCRQDWNEFIAHISGGLLYGHEVKLPRDYALEQRREKRRRTSSGTGVSPVRRVVPGGAGVPAREEHSLRLAT